MMQRQRFVYLGLLSAAIAFNCPLMADDKPLQEPAAGLKADNDRLRQEVAALESRLRAVQVELDQARAAASQAQMQADAFELRCRKLQEQMSSSKSPGTLTGRSQAGPPRAELAVRAKPTVEGPHACVTAVGSGGKLLQISKGASAGMKEGQTLQLFRPGSPDGATRPLYLGTMLLIRVEEQAALGEFTSVPSFTARPKIGDEAAIELSVK
jgi:hypothetical protein